MLQLQDRGKVSAVAHSSSSHHSPTGHCPYGSGKGALPLPCTAAYPQQHPEDLTLALRLMRRLNVLYGSSPLVACR